MEKAFQSNGTAWAETKGYEAAWHIRETINYSTWGLFMCLSVRKWKNKRSFWRGRSNEVVWVMIL